MFRSYDDFDGTLGNLGRDAQSLEERSFLRSQSCVLGRNNDAERCDGSSPGRGSDFVLDQLVPDFDKVSAGEYKTDVATDVGEQLLQGLVTLDVTADSLAHHSVLSHQHNGGSTQRHTDLLHLLRPDIVRAHDETFRIVVQKLLKKISRIVEK